MSHWKKCSTVIGLGGGEEGEEEWWTMVRGEGLCTTV